MVISWQLDFIGRPSWSHQLPCSKSSLTRREFQFCVHVFLMVYLTFCRCTEDYNWSEHWRSDLLSLCWVSAGHPSHHSTSSHLHQRYCISLIKKWRLTLRALYSCFLSFVCVLQWSEASVMTMTSISLHFMPALAFGTVCSSYWEASSMSACLWSSLNGQWRSTMCISTSDVI